jgi:phosphonate metabolism protein (transferase hexapeptide repeat family)
MLDPTNELQIMTKEAKMNKETISLSKKPFIHKNCQIITTTMEEYTEIGAFNFLENVIIRRFSYTGPFCFIQNAQIESFSNIAATVRIGPTQHPMDRATMHHFMYRRVMYGLRSTDDEAFFQERAQKITFIGHDTWLGHGCIIMPGIRIGTGAVVGSGSVVTRDVDDYAVVVGAPAKKIRMRFDDSIIAELNNIAWWKWDYETIKERLDDFSLHVSRFVEKYRGGI